MLKHQLVLSMPPLPQKIISRKEEITQQFLQLVDAHFDDVLHKRVDDMYHTKDFAAQLFIHPVHLSNTIKLTTGKSPCDLMEERMMREAEKMLTETDMQVKEIGYLFTYDDPTNFTKFFKSMRGITPLQYRKKHQAGNLC